MTVKRFDFGRVGKVRRTPQGGVRVPAALTRVGILEYRRADGSVRRELRPPEEVFKQDSLSTLVSAPVTDLHPNDFVTSDNWRQLSIGHVGDEVKQDGRFVAAELAIQDSQAVKKIDAGERKEISCGYQCDLEQKSGVYEGQRYDAIQRNIVYNHVAIGPNNWGRAGSDVSLRLDSDDAVCFDLSEEEGPEQKPPKRETTMKVEKIDGIDYEVGSEQHVQVLRRKLEEQTAEAGAQKKRADEAEGKSAQLDKDLAEANDKVKELEDPKRLDDLVRARTSLIADARKLVPESDDPKKNVKFDGLSDREVMVLALRADDEEFDDEGRSDDFVAGMFGVAVKKADAKAKAERESNNNGNLRRTLHQVHKKDEDDEDDDEDPGEKFRRDSSNRWRKPLAMSKDRKAAS